MECPGCSQGMLQERYEGVLIDHCHRCGGTWLDLGEIEKVVSDHSTQFNEPEKIKAIAAKGKDHRDGKKLRCPKCKLLMETQQYIFNSGVYIDRCREHGLYFDHGELEKAQIILEESLLQRGEHSSQKGQTVINQQKICPRDATELRLIDYETEQLDRCDQCGGMWCDDNELGRITASRLKAFKEGDHSDIKAEEDATQVSVEIDLCVSLNCAVCRKPMARFNYGYNSGIVVDRCHESHGIWFDADELERVQLFIERWEGKDSHLKQKYGDALRSLSAQAGASFEKSMEESRKKGAQNSLFGRFVAKISKQGQKNAAPAPT